IESGGRSHGEQEAQPGEAGIAIRAFPPPPRSQPPRAPALEGPSRAGPAAVSSAARDLLPAPESFAPARAARDRAPEGAPRRWGGGEGSTSPAEAPAPGFQALAAAASDEPRREPVPAPQLEDTPYRSRFGAEKEVALLEHGGSPETERAVALGLAYLASIQHERGYWGSRSDGDAKYRQVLVGKSGLCLLAFLGAGHTPVSGTRYSGETRRAVEFLLSAQDPSTGHFGDSEAYSHGIATYALAECYAMTRMAELRGPLELAVAEVLRHQVRRGDPRKVGGWSYYYPDGATFDSWPRVSITAWQVMALESARLGGLAVPGEAFQAARSFLLGSWDLRLGAFRYSHDPDRLRSGFPTLPGSTPAALFALALLGEDVNEDRFTRARGFVLERAPREYDYGSSEDFVFRARGNTYFWYYGSLAMFVCGGEPWERWNTAMKEVLVPSQQSDGSWIPLDAYAEYAGDDPADRSYTTAACVLTLEVYYRYFTPLLAVR
ncbi:MAG TPA: hypothetical protein VMS76_11935, partial [Planctomycetota bacterium]|nr:hypothetical protein [Planctomycetota bacterium]